MVKGRFNRGAVGRLGLRYGLSHTLVLGTDSRWAVLLRSLLTGFAVFLLGSLSDVWLQLHSRSLSIAIVDDALVGLGAGLLVLFYERRQGQNIVKKLQMIRLMNHHVRNSLQVISTAACISEREELVKRLHDAVERIEWALREVLPGQREDVDNLVFHSPSEGLSAQAEGSDLRERGIGALSER